MISLTDLEAQLRDQRTLPPLHLWQPSSCGDIDIRIDREGRWFHEGSAIERAPLVALFASILRREGPDYYLVTPVEKLRIHVEDAPLLAVDAEHAGEVEDQRILLELNTGRRVTLDVDHPLRIDGTPDDPRPYVELEYGVSARLTRPVYYRLVDLAIELERETGLWSCGCWFPLAPAHT